MVLPSLVYRNGTFFGPVFTARTRQSLYLASWLVILWMVNLLNRSHFKNFVFKSQRWELFMKHLYSSTTFTNTYIQSAHGVKELTMCFLDTYNYWHRGSKTDLGMLIYSYSSKNRGWKTDLSYNKVPEAILAQGLNNWPALYVINKTEIFVILFDLDDIHETTWELLISSDFAIDLDQSLLENSLNFFLVKSVLQSVSQEEGQRHRLTSLVWARAGSHGVDSSKFVQHPWFRSC